MTHADLLAHLNSRTVYVPYCPLAEQCILGLRLYQSRALSQITSGFLLQDLHLDMAVNVGVPMTKTFNS